MIEDQFDYTCSTVFLYPMYFTCGEEAEWEGGNGGSYRQSEGADEKRYEAKKSRCKAE
jgi:hypothetical protein